MEFAEEDALRLTVLPDRFVLDLGRTKSSGNCGAGAQLPQRLVVRRGDSRCRAQL